MSELEKLNEEYSTLQQQVNERISSANTKKLPGKVRDVACNYGRYNDWGGGEYNFHEKGLSITYSTHGYNFVEVNLGHETEDVFRANVLSNDVGEIHLYIPGEWEQRIEALFKKIPKKKECEEIISFKKKINTLKEKWQLEGN